MYSKKEKYLELPNLENDINKNDSIEETHDISFNKKKNDKDEILLIDYKKPKFKVSFLIYCISSIIFIIIGYLICYFTREAEVIIVNKPLIPKSGQKNYNKNLINEVQNEFGKFQKVNINNIEEKLGLYKKKESDKKNIKSTVHIAFTLDPGYVFETMLTMTSMIASQKDTTKLVFHLGVINNFKAENMLRMYELKEILNNKTEFNFYNLSGAMEKMQNFHKKGAACPGKFELPELLPDDVNRVLLFDGGDVLVLRDLTELYNYNLGDKWVLGPPEPSSIVFVAKYNRTEYINIGSILLNVNELKKNNFWDEYTKNRNLDCPGAPDQTLFNILVPDDKKGYFPFRLGGFSILKNDQNSDKLVFEKIELEDWLNKDGKNFPENPYSEVKLVAQLFNSVFIHQFIGKWDQGSGLSIYRHLAKYFIRLGGLWDDLCKKKPKYCI